MSYHADARGYYGKFGGAYIPEMLYPNVEELRTNYLAIIQDEGFQKEFNHLLKDLILPPPYISLQILIPASGQIHDNNIVLFKFELFQCCQRVGRFDCRNDTFEPAQADPCFH